MAGWVVSGLTEDHRTISATSNTEMKKDAIAKFITEHPDVLMETVDAIRDTMGDFIFGGLWE